MAAKTEGMHAGEFIVAEANGDRSRESITIKTGQVVKAGSVIGKEFVGTAASAAFAGNTGNGAMGAVTVSGRAKAGVYKLTIVEPGTNVGTFQVEDPNGNVIGTGVVAAAFSAGGLAFTLADGTTDFVAGDGFNITVAEGASKYGLIDPEATNGFEVAAGVSYDNYDATAADVKGVAIVRDCTVNDAELDYSDADATEKALIKAQLAALGIIVRSAI